MNQDLKLTIPIFVGYDRRERAATNVLIDSLYQNSSCSISVTPLVTDQLVKMGIYNRDRDPKQSTDFSFSRFLVPYLMNYEGWAIFMDCDMLCTEDINNLWKQRDDQYSIMCVKHEHIPSKQNKFLGEVQSKYPKKNWSSMMLLNCSKCKALTPEYVNKASGLELHRFLWLNNENLIGEISSDWNFLISVQKRNLDDDIPKLMHWTLGGPWFKEEREKGNFLDAIWFQQRTDAMRLWS